MRVVLTLLMLLVACPVWAEWIVIGVTSNAVFYIDRATIRKNGDLRRVWVIQDLKQRDSDGVMSRRVLEEYGCKEKRRRILEISVHSERMAGGHNLDTDSTPSEWERIAPGVTAEGIFGVVCAR